MGRVVVVDVWATFSKRGGARTVCFFLKIWAGRPCHDGFFRGFSEGALGLNRE